jgi:hypothetical protein
VTSTRDFVAEFQSSYQRGKNGVGGEEFLEHLAHFAKPWIVGDQPSEILMNRLGDLRRR